MHRNLLRQNLLIFKFMTKGCKQLDLNILRVKKCLIFRIKAYKFRFALSFLKIYLEFMQIEYKKVAPPLYLKNYVRYFWTLEDKSAGDSKTFRIIADGCPGFLFNQSEKSVIYQNNSKLLPAFFLYGQATRHSELNLTGESSIIGACFYPNALKLIFGLDANELTDSCIDLNFAADKKDLNLPEKRAEKNSLHKKVEMIADYLASQIRKNNPSEDRVVQTALAQIIEANGNLSLAELRRDLGLSERSLERKFKQNVGIPPKLFSRIWRFQSSLEQLRKNDNLKLSDIAYDNEYADQSHFIRAFREFAGFSPNQFKNHSNEIGENLSRLKV